MKKKILVCAKLCNFHKHLDICRINELNLLALRVYCKVSKFTKNFCVYASTPKVVANHLPPKSFSRGNKKSVWRIHWIGSPPASHLKNVLCLVHKRKNKN